MINTQISIVYLYTDNKVSERVNKTKNPITVASKGIKYIGMNLAKEMKDSYLENYKLLMK